MREKALEMHKEHRGKTGTLSKPIIEFPIISQNVRNPTRIKGCGLLYVLLISGSTYQLFKVCDQFGDQFSLGLLFAFIKCPYNEWANNLARKYEPNIIY